MKTPRNPDYLRWLSTQRCCQCGRYPPCHAHHATTGGMSIKGSDYEAIPLCPPCHAEWHHSKGKHGGMDLDTLQAIFGRYRAHYRRHKGE